MKVWSYASIFIFSFSKEILVIFLEEDVSSSSPGFLEKVFLCILASFSLYLTIFRGVGFCLFNHVTLTCESIKHQNAPQE